MQKLKLNNGKEFNTESIIDMGGMLEITFVNTTYQEVADTYDSYTNTNFDSDALRRFELYSDANELQGAHLGYTETQDISSFNGVVKVKIKQEDPLKTEVELLKHQNEILNGAISELTIIVATMSTTK